MKRTMILFVLTAMASLVLGAAHSDSIPPYQYDAGARARLGGDPLTAQCDLRKPGEDPVSVVTSQLYYSTDGQASWSSVAASNVAGDRWIATTPGASGDIHWRFFFEGDSTWAGQSPVYSGSSTCRLPANWYVTWEDTPGLDSTAYGAGDWLDIRGAGFCISDGRFYGKIIKATDDWRKSDGSRWWTTDLFDDNYGYMFAINNPAEPTGNVFYAITHTVTADPPDLDGHVELDQGILKVVGESEIYLLSGTDDEFEFVAETMFVSCAISDLTGETDFGTWPNDIRYLNVSVSTMHLHQYGSTFDPSFHQYFADESKSGHIYYNDPIDEWVSSPTAPNTSPLLSSPSATYDGGSDQTTVEVVYSDADENPPEEVTVEVPASRAVYTLTKSEVVGTYGWIDGVTYSTVIPGYHGFGAEFTFTGSDGVDSYVLPAGALSVNEAGRPEEIAILAYPNPLNSAIYIELPRNAAAEIGDASGRTC